MTTEDEERSRQQLSARQLLDDDPPPQRKSVEEVAKWEKWMHDKLVRGGYADYYSERRRPVKPTASSWLANSMVYLCVFCAAALMLCFVLWVASCTLQAMKGF